MRTKQKRYLNRKQGGTGNEQGYSIFKGIAAGIKNTGN